MDIIKYPWQSTPTRLIKYALELAKKESEFDKQVAFLLLDVGVETLFKVYLSLPEDVTKSKVSYSKRNEAMKGSFHILVKGIEDSTGNLLDESVLNRVRYFHSIRNKLYHQGDGVSVNEENLQEYAEIAPKLLKILLDVDLNANEPSFEEAMAELENQMRLSSRMDALSKIIFELKINSTACIAVLRPEWAMMSFRRQIRQILDDYPDDENAHLDDRYENKQKRIKGFSTLIGKELPPEYDWLIQLALEDITYLYLVVIFQKQDQDWIQEAEKYELACLLSQSGYKNNIPFIKDGWFGYSQATNDETVDKINETISWIEGIQKIVDGILESGEHE